MVYALGEIKEVITEPGLKFKLPPPFQNVVFLDKRIQTLDSTETRAIFTAEKKSLVIDWLAKWRIAEPRQFIRNNGTDFRNLESRLSQVVQAAFNEEVTKRTVRGVLSDERDKVMQDVRSRLADEAKSFGIELVDVRIKRVDFVADITDSVYRRMQSERQQVANELRSQGVAEGEQHPRRRRPPARGDRRRGLSRCAEAQGRGRRQGVGAVRRCLRARSAVRAVLSQPRGLPRQLSQPHRRDGGRSIQRLLQGDARRVAGNAGCCGAALADRAMIDLLLGAVALMLVFEGLLPFLSPTTWRDVFSKALRS